MFRTLATGLFAGALVIAQTKAPQTRTPRKAAAQPAPAAEKRVVVDPSQPFPIESIKVTGNQHFSEAEVIRMSGLQPGQHVRKPDFDAAQQRLLDSGLFETVAYRYAPVGSSQGYAATFEVKEIGQMFAYRFEAIDVPDKELRAHLKKEEPLFADRIPATQPILKRFTNDIEKLLTARNKPLPITAKLTPNDKGQLEVVFQPSSLPAVAQVLFSGNKAISNPTLQSGITGAAIGALYTEPRFRQILDASVRPMYEALGYLRVSFPKIDTKPASDVKGVNLDVHIAEGPIFKLRDVKLAGDMSEDARLMKEGNFRVNETADMKAVEDGTKRMERALKRRGFLNASTKVQRTIDDKEKAVDLTIEVDAGPQYRMGKLDIQGLDVTTEPHIRKMWALKEKAPFDFEYPDIFLSEMPNVLDNVGKTRSAVKPDSGTLTVDVLITFAPEPKKPDERRRRPDDQRPSGPVDIPF